MDFSRKPAIDAVAPEVPAGCCPVVELRQYALHPGQRESLISLFDREFVETQEATGMQVIAQFRDIDRPDVFTWLWGFPDMTSRAASLGAFYGGPVWAAHRDAANATMISSDNVRLLRPARPQSGFMLPDRPGPGATSIPPGLLVATIYTLAPGVAEGFTAFFESTVAPRLKATGAAPFAVFQTEPSQNTFPRLPVREGEHAFVWFARFPDVGGVRPLRRCAGGRSAVGRRGAARARAPAAGSRRDLAPDPDGAVASAQLIPTRPFTGSSIFTSRSRCRP